MGKQYFLFKRPRAKGRPIWYVQFVASDGKRMTAKSTGKIVKGEAVDWVEAKLAEVQLLERHPHISLHDWADKFFIEGCPHISRRRLEGKHYSEKVAQINRGIIRRYLLDDPIGERPLAAIRRIDVLEYRKRLVDRIGRCRSAQVAMGCLRVILHEALFHELLDADPTAGIGKIAYDAKVRTAPSIQQVLAFLDRTHWPDELLWLATWTVAMTGLRAGEARALQWGDLRPPNIFVTRALSGDATKPDLPKWGKTRVCAYPKKLQGLLEPRRGKDASWVFLRGSGPIGYGNWQASVKTASEAAGLKGVTLHSLRHALNTTLRGQGAGDELLRGAFGWSGPEIQENYTHRDEYDYSTIGKAVDKLFGGEDGTARGNRRNSAKRSDPVRDSGAAERSGLPPQKRP